MVSAGDPVSSSDVTATEDYTIRRPLVRLVQGTAQTGILSNTPTAIVFSTEDIDTHGYHDTTTNNTRITPTLAGYYRIHGNVCFPNRTDWTLLYVYIRKNGSAQLPAGGRLAFTTGSSGNFAICLQTDLIIDMNGTDYLELLCQGINTAAAAFSTTTGGPQSCTFEAEFLRPI